MTLPNQKLWTSTLRMLMAATAIASGTLSFARIAEAKKKPTVSCDEAIFQISIVPKQLASQYRDAAFAACPESRKPEIVDAYGNISLAQADRQANAGLNNVWNGGERALTTPRWDPTPPPPPVEDVPAVAEDRPIRKPKPPRPPRPPKPPTDAPSPPLVSPSPEPSPPLMCDARLPPNLSQGNFNVATADPGTAALAATAKTGGPSLEKGTSDFNVSASAKLAATETAAAAASAKITADAPASPANNCPPNGADNR